ncbi:TPA: hypothetical protein ACNVPG_003043 [Klebsiella aerogenes]
MNNEIEQIAQQNDMSIEFVRWFFNEKKADCGEQWFLALGAMWEGWKAREGEVTALAMTLEKSREAAGCPAGVDLQDWVKQLAAENVQVRERHRFIRALAVSILEHSGGRHDWRGAMEDASDLVKTVDEVYSNTPATARIVAGIKADGRAEGINFAASRLAAAFNHGHVNKPMAEVGDVVRMILTAKEDLANDPALPADGLSGEYAEKSLAEWEAALREGADK